MNLIIANTPIRQNVDGLYCLNDLHHASGGEARHKPSEWLRRAETQALLVEYAKPEISGLAKAEIPALVSIKGGNAPGTRGCQEVVCAYATWISPKFFLKVIRVFLHAVAGQVAAPAAGNLALAQEIGALRDDFRAMQQEFVGVLKSHVKTSERCVRLQRLVTGLRERIAAGQRIETVVRMEAQGIARAEIARLTGCTFGNIRIICMRARRDGRLPLEADDRQGELL